MRNPKVPLTEIALAVGYQTPSAFSAAFRRDTGMTPSSFRRLALA
jgi:AraC family transcriptional regulator